MSIEVKTFATRAAARGAITSAKATWVPPEVRFVNCSNPSRLLAAVGPLQMAVDAFELVNGRWAVIADHPSLKGEQIEESDIKREPRNGLEAAAPKGKVK